MQRRKKNSFLKVNSKNIYNRSVLEEIIENQLVVILLECDRIKVTFTLLVATSEYSSYMIIVIMQSHPLDLRFLVVTVRKVHLIFYGSYLPDL